MRRLPFMVFTILVSLATLPVVAGSTDVFTGILTVTWGDPMRGEEGTPPTVFHLTEDNGASHRLAVDPALLHMVGGLQHLLGQRVRVTTTTDETTRTVLLLEKLGGAKSVTVVTGSQPWVSVMCKFPDVADEPQDLAFFQNMFDNSPGRLDHYWRELSYGTIDVVGSTAAGWVILPENQDHYIPVPGEGCLDGDPDNDADLGALFADCTAAADHLIDFSNGGNPYVGINLMFNSDLDGCAWGGGWSATLDGVSKVWRTTWEPPWGYENVSVMAHEMGHGFGLPHSNNWDGDNSPYDNSWDVMSDAWYWAGWDATYGTIGKHTIAYHKADILGWISAAKIFEPSPDSATSIVIDDLALVTTPNYRMARIEIPGSSRYYTVEVRGWTGMYDANLPGEAVIIHEIDPGRSEPAWAYDAGTPPGNDSSGEGTMWRVGETFTDPAAEISLSIDSQTPDGFEITIAVGDSGLVFSDGFEDGDTGAWSVAVGG